MPSTIGQLTPAASAVGADQLEIEVAATVASRRITVTDLGAAIAGTLDHGNLSGLADDDHAQYYNQARGDARYATLAAPNTFTAAQVVSVAAGQAMTVSTVAGGVAIGVPSQDNAASGGGMIQIGSNNSGATPAPGAILCTKVNPAGVAYLFPDDAGLWRTHLNALCTSANRNSSTVVGTQTSSLDSKDMLEGVTGAGDVFAAVQRGAEAVRRFTYKNGAFNGEEFEGVVVDHAPRYGMDRDEEHPAGKSLNTIVILGDLLRAVDYLAQRVAALEAIHAG